MQSIKDIEVFIRDMFPDVSHCEVYQILNPIMQVDWNVGTEQLIRSLLFLSEGDIARLKALTNFKDPRDIIMQAEEKRGYPGDYGNTPFPHDSF